MGMTIAQAVSEYGWLVARIARRYRRPGVDLEDVQQEGFIGLMAAARTWEEGRGASFKSWADQKIRYQLRAAFRGSPVHLDDGEVEVSVDASQEAELGAAEERRLVSLAISRLTPADRSLLESWAGGESHAQIAARIGAGRQTVTDRFGRALEKARRLARAA